MAEPNQLTDIIDELLDGGGISDADKAILDVSLSLGTDLPDAYRDFAAAYAENPSQFFEASSYVSGAAVMSRDVEAARAKGRLAPDIYSDAAGNRLSETPVNRIETNLAGFCANGAKLSDDAIAKAIQDVRRSGNDADVTEAQIGVERFEFPDAPNPIAAACDLASGRNR